MKPSFWQRHIVKLWLVSGTLIAFQGCGLSDRELAGIWQSALTTGLSSLMQALVSAAVPATA